MKSTERDVRRQPSAVERIISRSFEPSQIDAPTITPSFVPTTPHDDVLGRQQPPSCQRPTVLLKAENERHIVELLGGRELTLLAAWGELIETRSYLLQMLESVVAVSDASGCDWVSIGDFLKSGHPRHPSRASYDWPLQTLRHGEISARSQGLRPVGMKYLYP